jgi:hypothetical protein
MAKLYQSYNPTTGRIQLSSKPPTKESGYVQTGTINSTPPPPPPAPSSSGGSGGGISTTPVTAHSTSGKTRTVKIGTGGFTRSKTPQDSQTSRLEISNIETGEIIQKGYTPPSSSGGSGGGISTTPVTAHSTSGKTRTVKIGTGGFTRSKTPQDSQTSRLEISNIETGEIIQKGYTPPSTSNFYQTTTSRQTLQNQLDSFRPETTAPTTLNSVQEQLLKKQLGQPTQTIYASTLGGSASSKTLDLAKKSLEKPLSQRNFVDLKNIESAYTMSGTNRQYQQLQNQLETTQKNEQQKQEMFENQTKTNQQIKNIFDKTKEKNIIPNQDTPLITELGIYNVEKQVTQNYLNSPEYKSILLKLNKLKFEAEKEAGLKTESKATDIYNPDALTQRQIFYGDEKKAKDEKTQQEELFIARKTFQEELSKTKNPIIKGYFDPKINLSQGTRAGIIEFKKIETEMQYAGTPTQKAFIGKEKNILNAILSTPQIISEQYKKTGTKTITNPLLIGTPLEKMYSYEQPIYTNIFEGQEITDLKAPTTYEEELEFKKQIGLRAGLATANQPYDIKKLTKDLETFRTDVIYGAGAGAIIGTIFPTGIGTVVGTVTGGLTGAIGGATNVITENIVTRQTGDEFLGQSIGTVTGIGAELISARTVAKAVTKTISANPRLIGTPKSIAYDIGDDKLRLIKQSEFKTGTGFLTRKFDVIDDVIIKKSDLVKNFTKDQTEAIFKKATTPPKYLTDNVIKNRVNIGEGVKTTDIKQYINEFTKKTREKTSLNELLSKIDVTEFSGVQRISVKTGKDLVTKISKKIKPTIYDNSLESISGFGQVKEAEKTILIKKGVKTFQFDGYGISYSQAEKLTSDIAKAQKGVKTTTKKIGQVKFIGDSKYTNIKEPEQIFRLNPKQTSTSLQDDFIYLKGKQKGSRLFTNESDEYSKFLSQTRQKGMSKTITIQGDETLISPVTKYKSDILTFGGTKGKGQIIKTSVKGLPDEYLLRIAGKTDNLPKGTKFSKATITKTGTKIDDALELYPVGIKKGKEIKLLAEPLSESKKPLLQKELEQAIIAYEQNANPTTLKNLQNLSTEMANLRGYPASIASRFEKLRQNTMFYDKFIKEEFLQKPIGLQLDYKKMANAKLEQQKAIIDFSKNGMPKPDAQTMKSLKEFETKYGRNFSEEPRVELSGDVQKTFLSDKALENYMIRLDTKKSKTITSKDSDIDKLLKQIQEKPKTKIILDQEPLITKTSGNTLLLQKTKLITKPLTGTATKNITTYKPIVTKSKVTTQALTSASTQTAFAKLKTSTKTLAGTKQDYYSRTTYARTQTQPQFRQLFAQPQLRLQAIMNISRQKLGQRLGLKSMALTKEQTKLKTKVLQDTKTLTDTQTLQDTRILQDTKTLTDTQTLQDTRILQDTKVLQDIKTLTDTQTITKTKQDIIPRTINIPIKMPIIPIPRLPRLSSTQNNGVNKTDLYHAQVRANNNTRWVRVTKKPLPHNKAWNQGLEVADNTIGQSVRLQKVRSVRQAIQDDATIRDQKFRIKKYKSKIPSNPVRIELRQFAIDTQGEKDKLSIAKYLANQRNKRFNNKKGVRLI